MYIIAQTAVVLQHEFRVTCEENSYLSLNALFENEDIFKENYATRKDFKKEYYINLDNELPYSFEFEGKNFTIELLDTYTTDTDTGILVSDKSANKIYKEFGRFVSSLKKRNLEQDDNKPKREKDTLQAERFFNYGAEKRVGDVTLLSITLYMFKFTDKEYLNMIKGAKKTFGQKLQENLNLNDTDI